MCGRMTLTRSGREIAEYFALEMKAGAVGEIDGATLRPRYNIAPSQRVATILSSADGARILRWKQWGLVPAWSKSADMGGRLFNARSETAYQKPSFRTAWKRRRCLIVADGFYEWTPRNRDHQPYHFRPSDSQLLALAGLYEAWRGEGGEILESCTVLTTAASADLQGIHHRMPVILAPSDFESWLAADSDPDRLRDLMASAPEGTLQRRAVSRSVNSPRVDDASCLDPIEPSDPSLKADVKAQQTSTTGPRSSRRTVEGDDVPRDAQGDLFGADREGGG